MSVDYETEWDEWKWADIEHEATLPCTCPKDFTPVVMCRPCRAREVVADMDGVQLP